MPLAVDRSAVVRLQMCRDSQCRGGYAEVVTQSIPHSAKHKCVLVLLKLDWN